MFISSPIGNAAIAGIDEGSGITPEQQALLDLFESERTVQNVTADGATTEFDLDNGRQIKCTLEATTEISFANVRPGYDYCQVRYIQDMGGGKEITHAIDPVVASGLVLDLSVNGGEEDHWVYETFDGGTSWHAKVTGIDMRTAP